ncbi:ABC transporter permease [Saccharothrix yanglingensis]|uniref:ABC transporter permease n=1 Tax=Saccharothrix yanglingensis TaxID=659496 RepID=A0ABU0WWU0_9PSEU|nr:ABC transporter permease [Saccharothrix yanglingensis]MDQ2583847.1 ABC transporter permease [Saccharothrix yanglingensis]
MTGVLSSELLKIRSVRSTTYVLLALALMLLTGAVVSYLMTADWDVASPDRQQRFDRADPGVVVVPFGQFCLGALGALAVTSEYGSGMIRTALVSVPRRGTFLLAKIVVVGAVSLVVAALAVAGSYAAGELITGDRPKPISAYDSVGEALPTLLSDTASMVLLALVGLGLGFLLRSTAGALVTLCALLFVLPVVTLMLPPPWNERAYSVMLPNLAPQLSGAVSEAPLSPPGAALVMLAYLVVTLGAGAVALLRRDA